MNTESELSYLFRSIATKLLHDVMHNSISINGMYSIFLVISIGSAPNFDVCGAKLQKKRDTRKPPYARNDAFLFLLIYMTASEDGFQKPPSRFCYKSQKAKNMPLLTCVRFRVSLFFCNFASQKE